MMNQSQSRMPGRPLAASRLSRRDALRAGGAGLASGLVATNRVAAGHAQEATPEPEAGERFSPERQQALTEIVLSALAATYTPGAVAGVWYPGQGSWMMAAGVSDLETAAPMALDDHVRIASITKTFTATVVLQLVEEGLLSLDDHLEQFITGIPNEEEITLRQLLNMTAGIYNYVYDPLISVDYVEDPLLPFTPEQAVEIVRAHGEADFAPGEQTVYSDTNYILLGVIIEQVTGRSVADEITERVIVPLGLTRTSFATTPEMPEPYIHGYTAVDPGDPLRDVTRSNPDIPWTAGAIISTLADLRTWAEALADGTLLSPEMQAERLDFQTLIPEPVYVGYGLGVASVNSLIGHNGGILGYSSWMVHEPESGATIVTVTNRASTLGGTADPIFFGIAQLLFPDHFPAATGTPAAVPLGSGGDQD
ncbi:MAG: beta-lactamase family protein [Chloroflexota bacterium]|nr:beta-lactamase family protein [Chloroflexota bacterium]